MVDPIAKESKNLPLIGLRDNEFYLNAQPTGLRVDSYQPLVLTYENQKWTYDAHMSVIENHKKFMGLFKTKTASSLLFSKMVPDALAAETAPRHYAKAGAISTGAKGAGAGAVIGLVIVGGMAVAGSVAAAPVVLVVLGAAATGAAIGAGVGYVRGKAHGQDQKASVNQMLTQSDDVLKVECTGERVQVSKQAAGRSVAVRFERIPPAETSIWQPIIDKIEKMFYGSTPAKNPEQMKYFVATQFGSNPAEVDVQNALQKGNSSFEAAFFTAKQGLALHVIESCKDMQQYIKTCQQKNSTSDQCAAPDVNVPPDQYQKLAAAQAACINANTNKMIKTRMMCIPGQQIYGTYAGWKNAPAAQTKAGRTAN